ncbi:MAG: histidine--tRNA ligase [Gammaproteobacteria bacterium]|nr:histidine--tRNA ligase [Gammaproteobacteria bacterium]
MYTKIKGTNDVLMEDAKKLSSLEEYLKRIVMLYGYEEIRVPILAPTELIHRSSGDSSDIVKKETFDFKDRGDRLITLRPEGTAPVIRAVIENKLYTRPLPLKLFYLGDMFRYERPQKGRYREFSQFGVEVVGTNSPLMDAEVITMASTIFRALEIKNFRVRLNTLGDSESRDNYRKALKDYFKPHLDELCSDCKDRFENNPLRILDCKVDHDSEVLKNAPKIKDYLSEKSKNEFELVKQYLELVQVPYYVDDSLVRGLDYYTNTIFEIEMISDNNVGQSLTICAGGRYDNLMKLLGGPEMGSVGFAFGLERLADLLSNDKQDYSKNVLCQLIPIGPKAKARLIRLTQTLRMQGIPTEIDYESTSLKQHFKKSESNKAKFIIIQGDDELNENKVKIKNKLIDEEVTLLETEIVPYIVKSLRKENTCSCGGDCDCDGNCDCDK